VLIVDNPIGHCDPLLLYYWTVDSWTDPVDWQPNWTIAVPLVAAAAGNTLAWQPCPACLTYLPYSCLTCCCCCCLARTQYWPRPSRTQTQAGQPSWQGQLIGEDSPVTSPGPGPARTAQPRPRPSPGPGQTPDSWRTGPDSPDSPVTLVWKWQWPCY